MSYIFFPSFFLLRMCHTVTSIISEERLTKPAAVGSVQLTTLPYGGRSACMQLADASVRYPCTVNPAAVVD